MKPHPSYFAVPDPADPAKMTYWYHVPRGRRAGELRPWPPDRRGGFWPFDSSGFPTGDELRAAARAHGTRVAGYWAAIEATIAADPVACAVRFARWAIRCCCCGKTLTEERSKVLGIGPECRRGAPLALVEMLVDAVRTLHGKTEIERSTIQLALLATEDVDG